MQVPFKVKLLKDILYNGIRNKHTILKAGEVATYFKHTDVYCFESRDGYVPYFDRVAVIENKDFFEEVE